MREIKFRAWHKKEQCYLPIMEIHAFNWYARTYDDKYRAFEIDLEQFTGLHDKNGKEIYEGDIVEFPSKRGTINFMGIVVYEKFCFNIEGFYDVFL